MMKKMFASNNISPTYLLVRYCLEFLVVVFGITVSFWLNEWSQTRKEVEKHNKDTIDLLEDLALDKERLDFVKGCIDDGMVNTGRILDSHLLLQHGELDYRDFVDTLVTIKWPYNSSTFFMNNGTYKSLISSGRIQYFPSDVEKEIKDYYEYVSKRVDDNNKLIDQAALDYNSRQHVVGTMVDDIVRSVKLKNGEEVGSPAWLAGTDELQLHYSGLEYFTQTMAIRRQIFVHDHQLNLYLRMWNRTDSIIRSYMGSDLVGIQKSGSVPGTGL